MVDCDVTCKKLLMQIPYTGGSSQPLSVTATGSGICLLEVNMNFKCINCNQRL